MLEIIQNLLYYTIKLSTPLLFCTIGGVFVQRCGTMNFALEAAINTSCFSSIVFTVITGNTMWGIVGAFLSCILLNAVFGTFVVRFKANPVLVGLALNMLMMAIPPYLLQAFFDSRGLLMANHIIDVNNVAINIPFLDKVPLLGPILNNQTPLTYFAYVLIAVLTVVYYKTQYGVYVQVTGENMQSAEAVGISTDKIKWIALIISACCCALSGLNLTFEQTGSYSLNMSAARGLICLAAINCGRQRPIKSCAYAMIFGFVRALQLLISSYVDPNVTLVLEIIPYLTIIVVFLFTETPAARKTTMRFFREE